MDNIPANVKNIETEIYSVTAKITCSIVCVASEVRAVGIHSATE
jgi:hypothetical protein